MSALCGDKVRGIRVVFSELISRLKMDGLFTRKAELTNKVDKISIALTYLGEALSESITGGIGAKNA
ncbi:MAG: hypothetical protein ACXABO_19020 [Promethearchaeota archaeon]